MLHRRWTLFVAMLVSLSPMSFAQTSDWAIIRQLTPGQKVQVETAAGKSYVGQVESITDEELRVGKNQLILKQDVKRVRLWSAGHHGRNTLIGLGVGAGTGVVFGVASCGGKDAWFSRGECAAVSAPLFGGLGAAIGALMPSRGRWQDVYETK
jgi:hypothetical protein